MNTYKESCVVAFKVEKRLEAWLMLFCNDKTSTSLRIIFPLVI